MPTSVTSLKSWQSRAGQNGDKRYKLERFCFSGAQKTDGLAWSDQWTQKEEESVGCMNVWMTTQKWDAVYVDDMLVLLCKSLQQPISSLSEGLEVFIFYM